MGESTVFAQKMKEAREKAGLKQKELAEKIGVTPQTVSAYEKGGKAPTLENAVSISCTLGVSLDWLVSDEEKKAEKRKTTVDYVLELFEAVDWLNLNFDYELNEEGLATGRSVILLASDRLRGFEDLVDALHRLSGVRNVLEPDDYRTLVDKKIKAFVAEWDRYPNLYEEVDDELPF